MRRWSRRGRWILLSAALVATASLALVACGGEAVCTDVDCDFGECDSQTGQCINPEECREDNHCLPGYECAEYECVAVDECTTDDDCDVGVCENEACVNPSSCESDDECLERTFCGPNDVCEPDPCRNLTCQQGVCDRGTDDCVSAPSCTKETEHIDCIAGEKCADGTCESAEDFCDEIECDRGECSFEDGGCAHADNCRGDDELCLEGYFCNDQNTCQPNLCEQNDIDCGDNGVCHPATGDCGLPIACEDDSDCLNTPPHTCFEGECRLDDALCGDAGGDGGCPGNQVCNVDFEQNSAECQEPVQCETSVDCLGERQCAGRTCIESITCVDDLFESNDASDEATDFFLHAEDNVLRASLCEDDSDVFTFNSGDIIDPGARGLLLVEADVPRRDQGLGQLEVELIDEVGNTQVASTGPMGTDGAAVIERTMGVNDHGEFSVEVAADDDMKAAGVEYELSINLIPQGTIDACAQAQMLETNSRISGDTTEARSTFLGASCIDEADGSTELIYALEVDAPQELTFELEPQLSSADLSMSLRSNCVQPASERACVDEATVRSEDEGVESTERMTALVSAGTHYLIVQSGDEASGGPFELTVDNVYTACSEDDDYCADANEANLCTSDGGRFQSVMCDAGCNPSTGDCFPPEGDTCLDAPVLAVEEGDEDGEGRALPQTFEEPIDLAQYSDEHELALGTSDDFCMELGDDASTKSGGADATFQIELPAKTAVSAEVSFANEVQGSLYLVEDCNETNDTCAAGAVESTESSSQEELTYANFSEDEDQTLYLIVDTDEGESVSVADLTVTFEEVICEPAAVQCAETGNTEICDDFGTGFDELDECPLGCEDGACLGETCEGAFDIPADGNEYTETIDLSEFVDDYDYGTAECRVGTYDDAPGHDAIFSVDVVEGDVITVSWDTPDDPSVYVVTDCAQIDNTCVAGTEATGDATAQLTYVAEQDGVHYIVGDVDEDTSVTYGDSEMTIQVSKPECDADVDAPSCLDSSELEYCNTYNIWQTHTCSDSCSSGACDNPNGDACFEAIDITSDAEQSGGTIINGAWDDYANDYQGYSDCSEASTAVTDGQEAVYEVTLSAGDTLDAELTSTGWVWPTLVVVEGCHGVTNTCVGAGHDSATTTTLSYNATSDETVYLIADHDWPTQVGESFTLDVEIN